VLAVIPARGGSKGVPRKNLRPLGGRPLVVHSIEAALGAMGVGRVVVSTDDEEIAEVARAAGADVPFLRPADLASDVASSIDAVLDAVETVEAADRVRFDAVLMLQPTSPFRTSADIDAAIDKLAATAADSVISVVDVGGVHPARMKFLGDGDRLLDPSFAEERENQNRQELTPMFIRNGAIYLTRRSVLAGRSFKGRDCRALVMPSGRSTNIDVELDLRFAEWLLASGLVSDEPAR
jgi:CMP-N-acetylneuraminic acid synthetase